MPPLVPGVIAWADPCPGLRPPTRHPIVIAQRYATGAVGVLYVSHSLDLAGRSLPLTPSLIPSAFAPGGPLSSGHSAIMLRDTAGNRLMIMAIPEASDRLRIGTVAVTLTRGIQLPAPEWQRLATAIRIGLA